MIHRRLGPGTSRFCLAVAAAAFTASPAAGQAAEFTGEGALSASTIGSGSYLDGEPWFIDEGATSLVEALFARVSTSGALSDGRVRGSASVEATITEGAITVVSSAQAYVRFGMLVDSFQTSATMLAELRLSEDTTFFIRRTGFTAASLSPTTGAIEGNILRAGSYELAGFAFATLPAAGNLTLSGTYTIVLEACRADWDGSGAVDSADVSAFLEQWLASVASGDLLADFDGDGDVNSADVSGFLGFWLTVSVWGC